MKHAIVALAAAGLIAAAMPAPAQAKCRGCGVAAGVVGGLALGAMIGSAFAGPRYYEPGPVYVAPPPPPPPRRRVYVEEYYGPVCHVERQRVWDGYGWRSRRVEVCE